MCGRDGGWRRLCYEDQKNMEDAKAWISRKEEVIRGDKGREENSVLSCPLLLVMGVEERAAFTTE